MTSFDVGVSLASIVESYRTYDESHLSIINNLVESGEWDECYLSALNSTLKLNTIFDTAIRVNNINALKAVYPKQFFSLNRRFAYLQKTTLSPKYW